MSKAEHLNFRVSSGLKTIIGKELITNDFIAVFELVKNSFDAQAGRVDISFNDLTTESPKLVIADDGKGMDHTDLIDKWLFVAYSAKKDGTEDYRDKIQSSRLHAGAKGIGRFSCDRLGSNLTLYSKKRGRSQPIHRLTVDWSHFERSLKDEFIRIPVDYTEVDSCPYPLRHGTVLEISELRAPWHRDRLLDLKHSLEKLINPNQENDARGFAIHLCVPDEAREDAEVPEDEPWNRVNGEIRNFLFENLGFRTTQITCHIDEGAKSIRTRLEDRGMLIYDVAEANTLAIAGEPLAGITVHLFFLNRSAKIFFTKAMGVTTRDYGSVFLYKNGFRIHPFGDVGDDRLGVDRRKQQGTARYLGTRDLSGRIEIYGDNPAFQETSSRDGGLVQNEAFNALARFFYEYALTRLERYVIDVARYGGEESLLKGHAQLSPGELRERILDIIAKLTSAKNVTNIDYDPNILNILESHSAESVGALLRNFKRMAAESDNSNLLREARKAERHLKNLRVAREEAEAERDKAEKEARKAEKKAKDAAEEAEQARREAEEARKEARQRTTQNLFLRSVVSRDLQHVVSLHHHISISAHTIEQCALNVSRKLQKGKPLSEEYLTTFINRIMRQVKTISTITRFATKARFNVEAVTVEEDVVAFVREYITNVCTGLYRTSHDNLLQFDVSAPGRLTHPMEFKPIEVSMILDNLISNAAKNGAQRLSVHMQRDQNDGALILTVRDDGKGILKKDAERIFEMGYSTTNGSGLGLTHVRESLKEMGGTIQMNSDYGDGVEFIIRIGV